MKQRLGIAQALLNDPKIIILDEHIHRTDQLVLSSGAEKESAYWAKILAGVTVSVVATTIMTLMTMSLNLGYYGAEGFGMPFQSCFSTYSYPITIGQACLIAYGILIAASVLVAILSWLYRGCSAAE